MDVNQVRFGEYYIGTSSGRNANRERKAEKEGQQSVQTQAMPSADREDILNALDISGAQNLAFVSKTEVQAPNPADFPVQQLPAEKTPTDNFSYPTYTGFQ